MPEVPLAVVFDESRSVLAVSGEVGEEATETLRLAIEQHSLGYTRGTTVDLTGATYLPSAAIGVLARAARQFVASGEPFELTAAAGSIAHRVLTVSAMPHRAT